MPYITQEQREDLDAYSIPSDVGELNYILTKVCMHYLNRKESPPRYQDFNDCLGAIEGCKLELYRRVVGPYETQKCFEHGDVYV